MEENIVVDCSINYRDYKRYSWFSVWNKGEITKFLLTIWLLICCGIVFLMIYQIFANGFGAFLDAISFSTVLAVAIPIAYYAMISLSIRRNYLQSKPVLDTIKHYEFTPDCVITDSFGLWGENGAISYSTFFKAFESRHAFYLYIAPAQAFIIPIRCMDKAAVTKLGNILSDTMGQRFAKKRFL